MKWIVPRAPSGSPAVGVRSFFLGMWLGRAGYWLATLFGPETVTTYAGLALGVIPWPGLYSPSAGLRPVAVPALVPVTSAFVGRP